MDNNSAATEADPQASNRIDSDAQAAPSHPRRQVRSRAGVAVAILMLALGVNISFKAMASATTVAPVVAQSADCKVQLSFTSTMATATIISGCVANSSGDYWLTSWSAQSSSRPTAFPQVLFAKTDHAPWQVALPSCFWQVDFVQRSAAPGTGGHLGQTLIAARLGGTSCATTTTSTTTASTTSTTRVNPPESTTTVPPTSTNVTTPLEGSTTTLGSTTTSTTSPTTAKGSLPATGSSSGTASPSAASTPTSQTLAFTGANSEILTAIALIVMAIGLLVLAGSQPSVNKKRARHFR